MAHGLCLVALQLSEGGVEACEIDLLAAQSKRLPLVLVPLASPCCGAQIPESELQCTRHWPAVIFFHPWTQHHSL